MLKRWEIYLVDFNPSRWSEQSWLRPGLIVQNDIWNEFSDTTIILAISSNVKNNPTNIAIIPDKEKKLSKKSCIKTSQILTISKNRLLKKIWKISKEDLLKVDKSLKISLDLK